MSTYPNLASAEERIRLLTEERDARAENELRYCLAFDEADAERAALRADKQRLEAERDLAFRRGEELIEREQRLQEALREIAERDFGGYSLSADEADMRDIARAALAVTAEEEE